MAWIELHQSLWTHKKTIMLAALLDIDELYAAAHMSKLWTWSLDNAQDGDLSDLPNRVIAFGAGWKGDANIFVEAIKKAGWIDSEGSIHDWFDYAGRLIEKKNANKDRMRKARATHVQRTEETQPPHVQGLPNLTLPNQRTTTTTAHDESDIDPTEPQSMTEAHQKVFGTVVIPPLHSNFLLPILRNLGERYAIELLLETGEAAGKPSLRYLQEVHAGWQKKGICSRTEAKANKQANIRAVPDKPAKTDLELESRKMEIARNQWIFEGNDPDEFDYHAPPGDRSRTSRIRSGVP